MPSLRDRIRQRRLAQWGLAYLAGAYVALEVQSGLAEADILSVVFQRSFIALIVVGLPVALVLAWFHGEKGAQRVTATEVTILGGLAVVGVAALLMVRTASIEIPDVEITQTPLDDGRETSIAVRLFDELSAGPDGYRLSDAIHDQVTTHLSGVQGLNPTSRTSVLAVQGLGLTLPEFADTLGADYVLETTIAYDLPRVLLNPQLIDPTSDLHVWAEVREFELTDGYFALQEEIADWVTMEVQRALGGTLLETAHLEVESEEAYELYLDGRTFANSRKESDFALAIAAYDSALLLDPDFAPALSSLALTYALWGHYGYGGPNASYETFGRALALADRSVQIAPDLAEAHSTRGYLLSKALAPADTVEPSFMRAIALAPGSSDASILYAGFLAREGRFSESLAESGRAVALDPIAPGRDAGMAYNALAAGDLTASLTATARASGLGPDLLAPRIIRALVLALQERSEECLELDLGPYEAVRAICLHGNGRVDEAEALIEQVEQSEGPRNAVLHVASYYAWTGDASRTLGALGQAYDDSPHGLDYRVVASGIFDPVRDDPVFAQGLAELQAGVWERVQQAREEASR